MTNVSIYQECEQLFFNRELLISAGRWNFFHRLCPRGSTASRHHGAPLRKGHLWTSRCHSAVMFDGGFKNTVGQRIRQPLGQLSSINKNLAVQIADRKQNRSGVSSGPGRNFYTNQSHMVPTPLGIMWAWFPGPPSNHPYTMVMWYRGVWGWDLIRFNFSRDFSHYFFLNDWSSSGEPHHQSRHQHPDCDFFV